MQHLPVGPQIEKLANSCKNMKGMSFGEDYYKITMKIFTEGNDKDNHN